MCIEGILKMKGNLMAFCFLLPGIEKNLMLLFLVKLYQVNVRSGHSVRYFVLTLAISNGSRNHDETTSNFLKGYTYMTSY